MNTRDAAFIPLLPIVEPAQPGAEPRLTVVPQASNAQPFRPLGEAKSPAPAPTDHNGSCEPRVTVQRDGDRVTAIQVQCSCGKVIELACVY